MSRILITGMTALFVTTATLAFAQAPSAQAPKQGKQDKATNVRTLTDARIDIVKAALQLTPDQEKLWPPIEAAIREQAQHRQARFAEMKKRMDELRQGNSLEKLHERNPIEFLQRRSDALDQRSADLKKLATAWQPLYQTLSPEQKQRVAFLAILALRQGRNAMEHRRWADDDDSDDDD